MVGPFCFAFIWFRVQGSRFRALVAASPPFLLGRCSKVVFKSPVTSHSYDTRERIVPHVWKGFHLRDMLRVLELTVLYYDTSSPLEKGRAKGAGWIHEAV